MNQSQLVNNNNNDNNNKRERNEYTVVQCGAVNKTVNIIIDGFATQFSCEIS